MMMMNSTSVSSNNWNLKVNFLGYPRKFTLRYQLFELNFDFKKATVDCNSRDDLKISCVVMYKTIFVVNIILHMCLQHSNTL